MVDVDIIFFGPENFEALDLARMLRNRKKAKRIRLVPRQGSRTSYKKLEDLL